MRSAWNLLAAAAVFSLACQGRGPPTATEVIGLTVIGEAATGSVPNPCQIDLDFGSVALELQESATLRIANHGKTAIDFSAPTTKPDAAFVADFGLLAAPLAPGASVDIPITFEPIALGSISSTFSIATSLPTGTCPTLAVELSGRGIGVNLIVDPTSLDFGGVLLDTEVQKTVTLTNRAVAPLTGLVATLTGPNSTGFSVVGLPTWLDAGASAQIEVSFEPQALASQSSATVTFSGVGQSATLNVTGTALAAALTLEPNPLDFGYVPAGHSVVACATATNAASVAVSITRLSNLIASDVFALSAVDDSSPAVAAPIPVELAPGASAKICLSMTPPAEAQFSGQAAIVTDAPAGTNPVLQLTGWGGGPQLSCTPISLAFPPTVDGTSSTVSVRCTNVGTAPNPLPPLTLAPVASPFSFGVTFEGNSYPPAGLMPGATATLDVSYHPSGGTIDTGTLSIASNGGRGQGATIPLTGQGLAIPPCQFVVSPASLDFGNVALGGEVEASLSVANTGTNECLIRALSLVNGSPGGFGLVSTSLQADPVTGNITLPTSSSFQVNLAFIPVAAGVATAELDFQISDPSQPLQRIPLRATSGSPCLLVVPQALDFGQSGAGCSADAGETRTLTVFNQCASPTALQAISLQSSLGDSTFSFELDAGLPLVIDQEGEAITVSFVPSVVGTHSATLVLTEAAADTLVSLSGTSVAKATATESFSAGTPKADILFVRDVSGDRDSIFTVAGGLDDLVDAGAGIDYRLAVTTDDDDSHLSIADIGQLEPCPTCNEYGLMPLIVTPDSIPDGGSAADPASVLEQLLTTAPSGDDLTVHKRLFIALFEALENEPRAGLDFFRKGAYFAAINESGVNSTETSQAAPSGRPPSWYAAFFEAWFADPALFAWDYIGPDAQLTGTGRFVPGDLPAPIEQMWAATNGLALNLQDGAWPQALLSLWDGAAATNLRYHLAGSPPSTGAGMTVSINGTTAPASAWRYDTGSNAVVFAAGSAPQNGDQIQVTFPIGCR